MPMLKEAASQNGLAHVINLSSIAGRYGQPWLSLYAATKAAVANWTNGMHKEFQNDGIRFTALSPAFVETPMTEFAQQGGIPPESMIRPEDLSSAVIWLLSLSPNARIPEIVFERVGDELF
jgi:short-subunit dehydrogenase